MRWDLYNALATALGNITLLVRDDGEPLAEDQIKTATIEDLFSYGATPANYKITVTVVSNNLVVTITHADGTTPSATRPLWVKIANVARAITGSLSITVNASTSTFAAGAASCAAQAIEFPTYLGYHAASGTVFLAVSRAFGRTYADFSNTATNEKYLAYSGSAPASTDVVELIGSFKATNSGSASYNWSISGTGDVKNYAVECTDLLSFNPQLANITLGNGTLTGKYKLYRARELEFEFEFTLGSTSAISGDVSCTPPLLPALVAGTCVIGFCRFNINPNNYTGATALTSTTIFTRAQVITGTCLAQVALTSTRPDTWATGNVLNCKGRYFV